MITTGVQSPNPGEQATESQPIDPSHKRITRIALSALLGVGISMMIVVYASSFKNLSAYIWAAILVGPTALCVSAALLYNKHEKAKELVLQEKSSPNQEGPSKGTETRDLRGSHSTERPEESHVTSARSDASDAHRANVDEAASGCAQICELALRILSLVCR